MCGRFTLATAPEIVAQLFELDEIPELRPRYNIAPTQPIAAITASQDASGPRRILQMFRWGLISSRSRDTAPVSGMINARAETVASKPAFRTAFRQRRCLIPADGFYEWQKLPRGKQPFYVHLVDRSRGGLFAFAGLWERWRTEGGEPIDTCTIITTEPNEVVAPIHDRMPVVLRPPEFGRWLHAGPEEIDRLASLLTPCPAEEMRAVPVGRWVNDSRYDAPECIQPIS